MSIAPERTSAADQGIGPTTGQTVRNMVDCLIAAVAVRLGEPVLHLDRDFEALARVTELEVVTA